VKTRGRAGLRYRGTRGGGAIRVSSLTDIVLHAQGEFGPQHDEGEGGVEVHVVRVVHPVLLACGTTGMCNVCTAAESVSTSFHHFFQDCLL